MPENDDKDRSQNEQTAIAENINQPSPALEVVPVRLPKSLRWVFIVGGVLAVVLLLVSIFHPYMTERVKFFTVNALSLLVLVAIVVQAIIYRRQWAVMEQQRSAMKGQLDAITKQATIMSEQRNVMERQLKATEKAADAAYVAQRAYIGVSGLKITSSAVIPPVTAQIIVGTVPTLHVTWHNGGGTPAEHFRAVPYLSFGEKPGRKGYLIDDDISDMQFNFIPAGKEITAPYPQAEVGFPAFTKEMLDQLNGGQKRLYAIIDAIYTDFAGQTRELHVEAIYDPFDAVFSDTYEYRTK